MLKVTEKICDLNKSQNYLQYSFLHGIFSIDVSIHDDTSGNFAIQFDSRDSAREVIINLYHFLLTKFPAAMYIHSAAVSIDLQYGDKLVTIQFSKSEKVFEFVATFDQLQELAISLDESTRHFQK